MTAETVFDGVLVAAAFVGWGAVLLLSARDACRRWGKR